MTTIERIACYIRVSTQEQKLHGLSLDAQRDTLKRFAETHNLKIIEWYEDEGISGRKLIKHRPALQRMLNDAKNGNFDRIIFIKLDRYFRSVAEYYECQKVLEANNVTWTATEEKYDLTTANGRYWITQKLAMAEYEADQTGERIKLVNEYKIRTAQPLQGSHCQGLAYSVQKDKEGVKRVVPDPETKEVVMDFINHFLVHQTKSLAIKYANDKHGTNYSYNSFSKVLKDTKLYGFYRGNDNYCEPYIDKATFDEIQNILSKNIKTGMDRKVFLFSGLIPCPVCGRKLSGNSSKHRTQKRNGKTYVNTKLMLSYRCNRYRKDNRCTFNKAINDEKIEKKLLDTLEDYMNAYITEVTIEDTRIKNDHVLDKIKQVKGEMTRINNMYRKERISESEYDKEYEKLDMRLKELESALTPITERDLSKYKDLLNSNWRDLYNALTRENKRAFWRKYVKEIQLDENGRFIKPIFF